MVNTNDIEVIQRRRYAVLMEKLGWLHFKLALAGWALAMMLIPPVPVIAAIGTALHLVWTITTLVGAVISSTGLILSFRPKYYKVSLTVELGGLYILLVGPMIYLGTQITLLVDGLPHSFTPRLALTVFAYAMVAAVGARLFTVVPKLHKV